MVRDGVKFLWTRGSCELTRGSQFDDCAWDSANQSVLIHDFFRWPPVVLPKDLSGVVALVARGKCSHYHKARAAQEQGFFQRGGELEVV